MAGKGFNRLQWLEWAGKVGHVWKLLDLFKTFNFFKSLDFRYAQFFSNLARIFQCFDWNLSLILQDK